jgi:hypothetical protein
VTTRVDNDALQDKMRDTARAEHESIAKASLPSATKRTALDGSLSIEPDGRRDRHDRDDPSAGSGEDTVTPARVLRRAAAREETSNRTPVVKIPPSVGTLDM